MKRLLKLPEPLRLPWVAPIGHARSWPKVKPRRGVAAFMHKEVYDRKKLRRDSDILPWPKR